MDALVTLIREGTEHMPGHTAGAAADTAAAGSTAASNAVADGPMHGGMSGGMHAMSPFLFTRSKEFFVLFEGAFINSTGGFVAALILSFVFAIIATAAGQIIRVHEHNALAKGRFVPRIVGSLLHGVRQFLHYTAMLIVMTMNVWLIIAVVAGHTVGWFVYSVALHNRLSKPVTAPLDGKAANIACDC